MAKYGIKDYYKFKINDRLIGLNKYIESNRANKYGGNNEKKKNELIIRYYIKNQLKGVEINYPVFIRYTWIEKNKRRDLDNICFARKFIQDSLVKVGILKDDGWRYIVGFEDCFKVDKVKPGVLVEMEEVSEEKNG